MATGRLVAGNGRFTVVINPDPKQVAKDIRRQINRPMAREVGRLHKKYADIPVQETKRQATRAPRGQVRIGRAVKASASTSAITMLGGRGYPDFAGQVFGSKQYSRFAPWVGSSSYEDMYVIGRLYRDEAWQQDFMMKFVEGLSDLLETVWSGKQ
jgi:hypothetical protein